MMYQHLVTFHTALHLKSVAHAFWVSFVDMVMMELKEINLIALYHPLVCTMYLMQRVDTLQARYQILIL